nr:winged helix-turn-helix domain-containing protein [Acinetobacter sp. YH01024]
MQAIQTTPVASTSELREQVLPDLSLRSAQRYLKGLERAGYVSRVLDAGWHRSDARYFLTKKAKQLFEVMG